MSRQWQIRPETPTDIASIRQVNLAAFRGPEEADLVDALRNENEAWLPDCSFVALDKAGIVVGHALLTRCLIDTTPGLALAPCSVIPEQQRRGVGKSLIEAAMKRATMRPEHFVVVLGHPEYYEKFGFMNANEFGIRISIETPPNALKVLPLNGKQVPGGLINYAKPFGI